MSNLFNQLYYDIFNNRRVIRNDITPSQYSSFDSGGTIHIKPENKGKFTASAKAAGQSVQAHAHSVVKNPNASTLQKKRAQFSLNAKKWNNKALGGQLDVNSAANPYGANADRINNQSSAVSNQSFQDKSAGLAQNLKDTYVGGIAKQNKVYGAINKGLDMIPLKEGGYMKMDKGGHTRYNPDDINEYSKKNDINPEYINSAIHFLNERGLNDDNDINTIIKAYDNINISGKPNRNMKSSTIDNNIIIATPLQASTKIPVKVEQKKQITVTPKKKINDIQLLTKSYNDDDKNESRKLILDSDDKSFFGDLFTSKKEKEQKDWLINWLTNKEINPATGKSRWDLWTEMNENVDKNPNDFRRNKGDDYYKNLKKSNEDLSLHNMNDWLFKTHDWFYNDYGIPIKKINDVDKYMDKKWSERNEKLYSPDSKFSKYIDNILDVNNDYYSKNTYPNNINKINKGLISKYFNPNSEDYKKNVELENRTKKLFDNSNFFTRITNDNYKKEYNDIGNEYDILHNTKTQHSKEFFYSQPQILHNYIMNLRHEFNLKPNEPMTPQLLQKLKKETKKVPQDFFKYNNDKFLQKAFDELATNNPKQTDYVKHGGYIKMNTAGVMPGLLSGDISQYTNALSQGAGASWGSAAADLGNQAAGALENIGKGQADVSKPAVDATSEQKPQKIDTTKLGNPNYKASGQLSGLGKVNKAISGSKGFAGATSGAAGMGVGAGFNVASAGFGIGGAAADKNAGKSYLGNYKTSGAAAGAGALKGAAVGAKVASKLSFLGPIGWIAGAAATAIGAGAGALGSALANKKELQRENATLTGLSQQQSNVAQQESQNNLANTSALQGYLGKGYNKFGGKLGVGGVYDMYESGGSFTPSEQMQNRKLGLMYSQGGDTNKLASDVSEFVGNSHDNGGIKYPDIDTEVEGGEITWGNKVFSKSLGYAYPAKYISTFKGKIESKPATTDRINAIQKSNERLMNLFNLQELSKKKNNV